AWERVVLPSRLERYEPSMLDALCLTGEVSWARLSSSAATPDLESGVRLSAARAPVGATPVALFPREHAEAWHTLRRSGTSSSSDAERPRIDEPADPAARRVLYTLRE